MLATRGSMTGELAMRILAACISLLPQRLGILIHTPGHFDVFCQHATGIGRIDIVEIYGW
jgi:hypothetical protein